MTIPPISDLILQNLSTDKYISRMQLLCQLEIYYPDITDRRMRKELEALRDSDPRGAYIVSSLSGGYKLARDYAELEELLEPDRSRAIDTLERIANQKKRAFLRFTQTALFEGVS